MTNLAETQATRERMGEWLDNAVREEVLDALVGAWLVQDSMRNALDEVRTRITNERARAEHDCEPGGYIDWLDDTLAILDGKEG